MNWMVVLAIGVMGFVWLRLRRRRKAMTASAAQSVSVAGES